MIYMESWKPNIFIPGISVPVTLTGGFGICVEAWPRWCQDRQAPLTEARPLQAESGSRRLAGGWGVCYPEVVGYSVSGR